MEIYILKEEYTQQLLDKLAASVKDPKKPIESLVKQLARAKQEFFPKARKVTVEELEYARVYLYPVLSMDKATGAHYLRLNDLYCVDGEFRTDHLLEDKVDVLDKLPDPLLLVETTRMNGSVRYGLKCDWEKVARIRSQKAATKKEEESHQMTKEKYEHMSKCGKVFCDYCESDECENCMITRLLDDAYSELPDEERSCEDREDDE